MKRLKKIGFTLLGVVFCVSFFVALCGSISTVKTHDSLHEASSVSFINNPKIFGSVSFSYDSDFSENDYLSSFFGLIHFDSELRLFSAPSVDVVYRSTEHTKETIIPFYLLYHSLKTHLS